MRIPAVTGLALVACGASGNDFPAARFANQPVVQLVDDRRNVAVPPETTRDLAEMFAYDAAIQRPVTRALELPRSRRALGVNALDDVPDSTWFTNRVGTRDIPPAQIRNGPITIESPELYKPWTVLSTKGGGTSAGYIIRDSRGMKYVLKFDQLGSPEVETGTHVVVNRLLWAAGYNVAEDQIAWVRREELLLAPHAMVKDRAGNATRELREDDIDKALAKVEHEHDGRIRVMASRWLVGKPVGPTPPEGTRGDDPNDLIPHEMRRDLRGAYAIFAWVSHVDLVPGNFADVWVTDGDDPNRHYIRHYALDFGRALGGMAELDHDPRRSYHYQIDVPNMLFELVTFGLDSRPWSDETAPPLRGVSSFFDAATFRPDAWKPNFWYLPFAASDRFDKYWGAKIVASFSEEQIRAAVDAGRFSDPRAVEYLVGTLLARQRKTSEYWFTHVNPLDRFAMRPTGELCFDDLAIEHAGARASATRYDVVTYDAAGTPRGAASAIGAMSSGRSCTEPLALVGGHDGYTIVEIRTTRPGFHASTFVHLARRASTAQASAAGMAVIGVWRT